MTGDPDSQTARERRERLTVKIAKLLALSKSSNEHEASLAADRAQQLMLEHGIDWSQIPSDPDGPVRIGHDRITIEGRTDPWRRSLASAVASSVGGTYIWACEPRKWRGLIEFWVPEGTGEAVVRLYRHLEEQLELISKIEAARREEVWVSGMRWRRSWLAGATVRLGDRLQERADRYRDAAGSMPLVPVKSAMDRALEEEYPEAGSDAYTPPLDGAAFYRGQEDSDLIGLGDAEVEHGD